MRRGVWAFWLWSACGAGAVPLAAQDAAALGHWEADIDAGRLEGVREALDVWLQEAGAASPQDLGRARYLRARLMSDVDSARTEYASVALDGRSSYGARAWIRLAQLDLAVGEPLRALSDLERLRADYPSSGAAGESFYWSARGRQQLGELDKACEGFRRAITEARRASDAPTVERAEASSRACAPGGLRFSLQLGAYSRQESAENEASVLREAGYPARVFEESGLHKVRVGRFAGSETARRLERHLREAGYSVSVVAAES